MTTSFLWLYLAGLVHLLTLYGFAPGKHPITLLPLLPLAGLAFPAGIPRLGKGALRSLSLFGLGALLVSLVLSRPHAWVGPDVLPSICVFLAGLANTVVARHGEAEDRTAIIWIWCALWLLAGWINPALPLLGASLGAVLAAFGIWRTQEGNATVPRLRFPALAAFALAALLGKPWWDFGLDPRGACASAALAVGMAIAATAGGQRRFSRFSEGAGLGCLAVLFVVYLSAMSLIWGLVVGLVAGWLWARRPEAGRLGVLSLAVVLGLLFSFALHANLWIPGLRPLLWLGG